MDKRYANFEKRLDELICIACDWRLAWDGTGMHPEYKLQQARSAVIRSYKRGRKHPNLNPEKSPAPKPRAPSSPSRLTRRSSTARGARSSSRLRCAPLKGIGPFPMSPISAAERLREALA